MAQTDGSEDVNDFLRRVQELKIQRDQEDEERNRKLEEEILKSREERQARRAERARSLSPNKSSPANTPPPIKPNSGSTAVLSQSNTFTPSSSFTGSFDDVFQSSFPSDDPRDDGLALSKRTTPKDTSPSRPAISPPDMASYAVDDSPVKTANTTPLSRTPTLSWQQRRPTSGSRTRPLSVFAAENAARSPRATPDAEDGLGANRTEIAQSLAAKDPSWFRQTSERGVGSAAYRRNQVEDDNVSEVSSNTSRMQLPGMSRESSREPEKPASEILSRSSACAASTRSESPLPLSETPRLDPPTAEDELSASGRKIAMSPAQGRISPDRPDRPPSPTKGAGGFVQSAMLKRSDSVSKRWSVQSPTGISRGNSIRANRASRDLSSIMDPRTFSPVQDAQGARQDVRQNEVAQESGRATDDGFARPGLPASRSPSRLPSEDVDAQHATAEDELELPVSPSKTMNPRRWSPTKSSWLESALNKPDNPKPKPAAPQQPSWMAEIAKAKQRGPSETPRSPAATHRHQVSIGGLMRSPPPGIGDKPATLDGIYSTISSGNLSKAPPPKPTKPSDTLKDAALDVAPRNDIAAGADENEPEPQPAQPADPPSKKDAQPTPAKSLSSHKPKPETPPKPDLKAKVLSPPPAQKPAQSEPEFKSVFGQLRKTKTQNYVAPDEFKGNILRGKAGLSVTGGPQKTERKDEFKEAILQKKKVFQEAQSEGRGVTRNTTAKEPAPLPEALQRRKTLGRASAPNKELLKSLSQSATEGTAPAAEVTKPAAITESAPSRSFVKDAASSKLADRFNPGLANLLARGPPPPSAGGSRSPSQDVSPERSLPLKPAQDEPKAGPQLTHMTKGRARGPRRKAPSSKPVSAEPNPLSTPSTISKSVSEAAKPQSTPVRSISNSAPSPKPKPNALSSPVTSPRDTSPGDRASLPSQRRLLTSKSQSFDSAGYSRVESPTASPIQSKLGKPDDSLSPSIKSKPSPGPKSPNLPSLVRSGTGRISPKPQAEEGPAPAEQSPDSPDQKPSEDLYPRPLNLSSTFPRVTTPTPIRNGSFVKGARPLPTPPAIKKPLNPPAPAAKSPALGAPASAKPGASSIFVDFFGDDMRPDKFDVDTASIVASKPDYSGKILSESVQLHLINGDGRKLAVPQSQERTLFENNMYVCVHKFKSPQGRSTSEVYLWVGDAISESEAEDASLFAAREARNASAKLVKMRQGKESSEFLQALGGVVIIRRGSSQRHDPRQPHMLCGRRYLGQITFDEVDLNAQNLCSGFPFLIFTSSGNCMLWKGRGSAVDELSCAKLVGMELSATGEIEEVEDGDEDSAFLGLFPDGAKPASSAEHWKLRKNHLNYNTRLFLIDSASADKVLEIKPFTQADISSRRVFVLDAFFEVYIIVGAQAQTQYASFHTALTFVQEYSILAAGMEDRPFVPVSIVLMEGVPRDMKRVFRAWSDAKNANAPPSTAPSLSRGKSLKIVPLREALEAVKR